MVAANNFLNIISFEYNRIELHNVAANSTIYKFNKNRRHLQKDNLHI